MRFTGWRQLVALAGALILPATAQAQEGFRFRQPEAQFTVRFGPSLARASGPIFDDMRDRLTLGTGDFMAETVAGELLFRVVDAVDLGLGVQWSQSSARSEFRDFTYDDPQETPIEQTTYLRRIPFYATLRVYPGGRGESLARYAWVPKRFTPFVGGGGGVLWYRLKQQGDFVNETTYDIFSSRYESSGTALAAHLLAGVDYWVTPTLALTAEGRYQFAADEPGGDFNYSSIDLSGMQLTAGISLRF